MTDIVFHDGEIAAQQRAGFAVASAPIRPQLIPWQQEFVRTLDVMALAGLEPSGALTVTMLAGHPGFVDGANRDRLIIDLPSHADSDPLLPRLASGWAVGGLGIDFAARRRVRINGRVIDRTEQTLSIAIEQAYGNCPKYITPRSTRLLADLPLGPMEMLAQLDTAARTMIATADTALLATASGQESVPNGGVDLSHRGGPPGFLHLAGTRLSLPDFPGNRYMNSLGNLLRHPWATLLLIDIATGTHLHLRGAVTIDWQAPSDWEAVGRILHLDISEVWRRRPLANL